MADPSNHFLSIAFTHRELCTRCGTCVGVCPEQALGLDGEGFPRIDRRRCTACGRCARTCPGGRVDYRRLTRLTFGHRRLRRTFDGHVQKTYVGYALDPGLRAGGAGGGAVTGLLWHLLRHNQVQGCIVTRMDPNRPWRGEAFIARSYADLQTSQGSRYTVIPVNAALQQARRLPGKYALAALPCQVHGFRLAVAEDRGLAEKIPLVVGLFCGGSLEPRAVTELLHVRGVAVNRIRGFQFRGGRWPGKIRAVLPEGRTVDLHQSNYKDGAYNYFIGVYMPPRCQTCLDGAGEFADLSVSDAWTKDAAGRYKFPAQSRILVRTAAGRRAFADACRRGTLMAADVSRDPSYRTHRLHTRRKGLTAPLRVARWRRAGRPAPRYDLPPPAAGAPDRLLELAVSGALWAGSWRVVRYPLMRFLTSRWALPLIHLRLLWKDRKYRRSLPA